MAGKIMEIKEQLEYGLHDNNKPWTKYLQQLESKSGIDRLYIFISLIGVIGLWLVFGYAAQLVCNFVGFFYPAYASMKAIESSNKADDTQWLIYWVVFSVFSIAEFFADLIVGWFPLYWLAKCVFLIWLMVPSELNGSRIIYTKLIRPFFLKHQDAIDETISKVKNTVGHLLSDNPKDK